MKLFTITALLIAIASRSHQKTSPCPTVFNYDEQDDSQDTWYGTLRLKTNVPLHGIFIDVIFDGQIYVFGAYFKDVTTKDNLHFHIEDKSYRLNAGETLILKFYVKHSDYGRVPKLHQVRFNGQNICVDVPSLRPVTDQHVKTSIANTYDRPIVYRGESERHESRPKTSDNKHEMYVVHSVQPINSIVHHSSDVPNTNTHVSTPSPDSVFPESQVDPLFMKSRFSETSSKYNESSINQKLQPNAPKNYDTYDPIQDPTIWKKPTNSQSSTDRTTSKPTRQTVSSHEGSRINGYATSRTTTDDPLPSREFRTTTTTEPPSYFQGDYNRKQPSTVKPTFFQGDYAFIQNVESSTHYINSYDEDICGTVVPKANPLVTHGSPVHHAQFPWHGALYRSSVTELKYLCGATLISVRFALTAAHCVALEKSRRPVESGSLLLYLGKTDLKRWNGPEQDAKIDRVLIHNDYNFERFFADIALLKLKADVKFGHFVRPACLWNFDEDYKILINKVGLVPGWGYNEKGLVSEQLSYAQMPVVAHETCIWSNRDFFSKVTSNTSFCAGFRNGTSVCNGDSGGGMVFKQSNRWFLRGIVSVSAALQNKVSCDPNHYAVFTDVAKFLPWINSYM
ncbi:plasminogen-like [Topomyia yanbarensis]|uniref:plasminogen-like n=1 Tax=Topomyia yanbarensis TaxID=2498891 RepID=UPI00273C33F3|nr:plasminogen-like [Topomyia yanbarensis]